MRVPGRWVAAVGVTLLLLTGCGLTVADLTPGGPSKAERVFGDGIDAKLAAAIEAADAAEIDEQLAAGADPNAVGADRMTMLQFAVDLGRPIGVERLMAAKAEPDAVGRHGLTALHMAVVRSDDRVVELLIAGGADVNARATGSSSTPLHESVGTRSESRVRRLLTAGADPRLVTTLKDTPVHQAARLNAGRLILPLLDAGTDPRAVNSSGATFQDYYFGYDKAVLDERSLAERQRVADWLRARSVPVDPRA